MPDLRNPQPLNRYAYVVNNPLRYTDPDGQCFWGASRNWWGCGTVRNATSAAGRAVYDGAGLLARASSRCPKPKRLQARPLQAGKKGLEHEGRRTLAHAESERAMAQAEVEWLAQDPNGVRVLGGMTAAGGATLLVAGGASTAAACTSGIGCLVGAAVEWPAFYYGILLTSDGFRMIATGEMPKTNPLAPELILWDDD